MTDYSKMSDFEINCRVHAEVMEISGLDSFKAKDYCNNPADAWPIIEKNKIGVRNISGDLLECASPDGMKADYSPLPLRSSMIVFLMMQDEKNG